MTRPSMKVQNIRFGKRDWEKVQEAAAERGVSASEYVRMWARTGVLLDSTEDVAAARRLAREMRQDDHG